MKKNLEALLTKKNSYWLLIILALISLYFILPLGFLSEDSSTSTTNKDIDIIFGTGWSVQENSHRWSTSDKSKINLVNMTNEPKLLEASFSLNTLKESNIEIIFNSEIVESIDNIIPGVGVKDIKLVLPVKLGINNLEIHSSEKPISSIFRG